MTRRQQQIVDAMQKGAVVWRYTTHCYGWVIPGGNYTGSMQIRLSTIEKLAEAGYIVEDLDKSFYRAGSGSGIRYRLP